jgi:hypothetical protein
MLVSFSGMMFLTKQNKVSKKLDLTILRGQSATFDEAVETATAFGCRLIEIKDLKSLSEDQISDIKSNVKISGRLWFGDKAGLTNSNAKELGNSLEAILREGMLYRGGNGHIALDYYGVGAIEGRYLAISADYQADSLSKVIVGVKL